MPFELKAGTDSAHCVLFDPKSVEALLREDGEPFFTGEKSLNEVFGAGTAIGFGTASDGSYLIRLFVDETVPEGEMTDCRHRLENGLLRIPSGRLCATGIEYIPNKDSNVVKIEDYTPGDLGSVALVPPGNYRVDAFNFFSPHSISPSKGAGLCIAGCVSLPIAIVAAYFITIWALLIPLIFMLLGTLRGTGLDSGIPNEKPDLVLKLQRLDDSIDIQTLGSLEINCSECPPPENQ